MITVWPMEKHKPKYQIYHTKKRVVKKMIRQIDKTRYENY